MVEVASDYFHAFDLDERIVISLRLDAQLIGNLFDFSDWLTDHRPDWDGGPLSHRSLAHELAPLYRGKVTIQEFVKSLDADYVEWFFRE